VFTLEVIYESPAGLAQDWASQLRVGGLFAAVVPPRSLPPLGELELVLEVEGHAPIETRARLTVANADSLCVEILEDARAALAQAVEAILVEAAAAVEGAAAAEGGEGVDGVGGAEGSAARARVRIFDGDRPRRPLPQPLALDRKIATMSVSEKVTMALHGGREERQLLLRDRAGVVQSSLVRNPKISIDEILALARCSHLAPDAAETLAEHRVYGASAQVALALARNARTPIPIAIAMLGKLQPGELRTISKGLGVRSVIAQAARKRLLDPER
jgi:hypothetical protein